MRPITVKYSGDCRKCGTEIPTGAPAVYERRVGIFCPPCAPTDTEAIRAVRQEAADTKADRYDGWAAKRREKADAALAYTSHYTNDHAFNTQPGHIPQRARIIAQEDRAFENLRTAQQFSAKAEGLRHVRVAGDAERKWQAKREAALGWLRVGMRVETGTYGQGIVLRINRKTATVGNCGTSGTFKTPVDLAFLHPCSQEVVEGGRT